MSGGVDQWWPVVVAHAGTIAGRIDLELARVEGPGRHQWLKWTSTSVLRRILNEAKAALQRPTTHGSGRTARTD
ncbi:hypothetical protein CCHR01_15701 [Colletotrichum chrysophilum]|uniref:Uncharacterized protein n=1 Tax=Colletotrichum chrysophilum TaxID=1836956 RepID=A0AAD9A5D9_9PEZI|nr:hypothetical protein CCHR01_15701 [Colletotrichum chrysophilum]